MAFSLHAKLAFLQFVPKARFVSTFEQSLANGRMNLHRSRDHRIPDFVLRHHCVLSVALRVLGDKIYLPKVASAGRLLIHPLACS